MKIRTILFSGALLAIGGACNDETEHLDERAEAVIDRGDELDEAKDDVDTTLGNTALATAEVAHASADLATAEVDFAQQRDIYVDALRDRFRVYEIQNDIARTFLSDPAMTEEDRVRATDFVTTFERELGEAEMSIDALATATAAQWDSASATAANAFEQLDDAHADVYDALAVDRKIVPVD